MKFEETFSGNSVTTAPGGRGCTLSALNPEGSFSPIIEMADHSLLTHEEYNFSGKLNAHITKVVKEKFNKVAALGKKRSVIPLIHPL